MDVPYIVDFAEDTIVLHVLEILNMIFGVELGVHFGLYMYNTRSDVKGRSVANTVSQCSS